MDGDEEECLRREEDEEEKWERLRFKVAVPAIILCLCFVTAKNGFVEDKRSFWNSHSRFSGTITIYYYYCYI